MESEAVQDHLKKYFNDGPQYVLPLVPQPELDSRLALKQAFEMDTLKGLQNPLQ